LIHEKKSRQGSAHSTHDGAIAQAAPPKGFGLHALHRSRVRVRQQDGAVMRRVCRAPGTAAAPADRLGDGTRSSREPLDGPGSAASGPVGSPSTSGAAGPSRTRTGTPGRPLCCAEPPVLPQLRLTDSATGHGQAASRWTLPLACCCRSRVRVRQQVGQLAHHRRRAQLGRQGQGQGRRAVLMRRVCRAPGTAAAPADRLGDGTRSSREPLDVAASSLSPHTTPLPSNRGAAEQRRLTRLLFMYQPLIAGTLPLACCCALR
jgi:hypothetical protein